MLTLLKFMNEFDKPLSPKLGISEENLKRRGVAINGRSVASGIASMKEDDLGTKTLGGLPRHDWHNKSEQESGADSDSQFRLPQAGVSATPR